MQLRADLLHEVHRVARVAHSGSRIAHRERVGEHHCDTQRFLREERRVRSRGCGRGRCAVVRVESATAGVRVGLEQPYVALRV